MDYQHKKLIILDRDGVINYDSAEFIKSPAEWQPIPGSMEAIKLFNQAGKIVAVATNQSGIARGLFSLETLEAIHQKFYDLMAQNGAHIDALLFCPHGSDDDCNCRKPKPGMIQELLQKFNCPAQNALTIGDSLRDLQAGAAVGVEAILVKTGKGAATLQKHKINNPVYENLLAAARVIFNA